MSASVSTPYAELVVGDEAQAAQFDALTEAYDNVVAARVTLRTEIASQLGLTQAAVLTRLFRARQKLRKRLVSGASDEGN